MATLTSRNRFLLMGLPVALHIILLLVLLPTQALPKQEHFQSNGGDQFGSERFGRVALVIGNNSYKTLPNLNNAVRDAENIAARLQKLGFEVILRPNLERRAFFRDLQTFGAKLEAAEVGLIFFAGHGIHADGANWLIPSDAILEDEDDLQPEAIDSMELRRVLLNSGAKVGILILDACRDNPLPVRHRSFARGIRLSPQPIGQIHGQRSDEAILFSAAEGEVAHDGPPGSNSLFTTALLDALDQPNLSLFEVFQATSKQVRKRTNDQQAPYLSASLSEAYVLNRTIEQPSVQTAATEQEIKLWDSVLDDGSADALDIYLQAYPKGAFAALAALKRTRLSLQAASVTEQLPVETHNLAAGKVTPGQQVLSSELPLVPRTLSPDETKHLDTAHWQRIRDSHQIADLRGYLRANPDGLHKARALQLINELKSKMPKPGDTFKDCEDCPEMIVLPGAETSAQGRAAEDKTRAKVDIAIGVYEVTRGEFRTFVAETDHDVGERCWTLEGKTALNRFDRNWLNPGFGQTDAGPVVCVNWADARAYVEWLSKKTGYSYRLPSGAEWRYAARSGTDTHYSWGDEVGDNQANCQGCGSEWDGKRPAPVGSFPANPWGLHDMHGNVWEWVSSCRGNTGDDSAETCKERYLYGGSWFYDPEFARSESRTPIRELSRGNSGGFRVVRDM